MWRCIGKLSTCVQYSGANAESQEWTNEISLQTEPQKPENGVLAQIKIARAEVFLSEWLFCN